jgi:hypothetical protein
MVLPLSFIVMWLIAKERSEVRRCMMQTMQGGEMEAVCHCGMVRFRLKLTDGFKTARRCTGSAGKIRVAHLCRSLLEAAEAGRGFEGSECIERR